MSRCALVALDDGGTLFTLQPLLDPDLRLVVAAPALVFGDYDFEIDDATADLLGLTSAEGRLL